MKKLVFIAAASLALASCDSAPSEESPVQPAAVCDEVDGSDTCEQYDEVITEEDLIEGDVPTNEEEVETVDSLNVTTNAN